MEEIQWDLRLEGRAWGTEARSRYEMTPEKMEMIDGKLFWSDEDRLYAGPSAGKRWRQPSRAHRKPGRLAGCRSKLAQFLIVSVARIFFLSKTGRVAGFLYAVCKMGQLVSGKHLRHRNAQAGD